MSSLLLEGQYVRLEPLHLDHLDPLCEVGLVEDVWKWNPNPVRTRSDMRRYIERALSGQEEGTMIPFATVERASEQVVGTTRFGRITPAHRRLEIGWTWIAPAWQRTAINTEAKYLMLTQAFDEMECIRVELRTDALNERSRRAILRIGATEEGTLRKHMITSSGRVRDTVVFSILASEWPVVRKELEERLAA